MDSKNHTLFEDFHLTNRSFAAVELIPNTNQILEIE